MRTFRPRFVISFDVKTAFGFAIPGGLSVPQTKVRLPSVHFFSVFLILVLPIKSFKRTMRNVSTDHNTPHLTPHASGPLMRTNKDSQMCAPLATLKPPHALKAISYPLTHAVGTHDPRLRMLARRVTAAWACIVLFAATPGVTKAADYTWSGGASGTWDTTSLNWNSGDLAWPNVESPADNAIFSQTTAVTVAAGTIYVNTINVNATGNNSFTGAGAATTTLAFRGDGARVSGANPNDPNRGAAFSNLTIDTGNGLRLVQHGAATPFTFGPGVVVTGTGAVTLSNISSSVFGAILNITTTENSSFGGGFIAEAGFRGRRLATISGTTAGAFGTGVAIARGDGGQLVYASGAQAAVNGVTAGLVASNGGLITMSGSFGSSSRDRFTIGAGSILSGTATATQLAAVGRVSSFSASPTQAEVIFGSGATIATTTNNTNIDTALSAMNLGTASDLYFGLGANFSSPEFAITIGANTPWQGFSTDGNVTDGTPRVLSSGTITVNTGDGTYGELRFQSLGREFGSTLSIPVTLGTSTSAPTFVKNGSGDIVARITPYGRLILDNASVGSFFASYAVDRNGTLSSTRTSAFAGKDVSLTAATVGVAGTTTDNVGTLTIAEQSRISLSNTSTLTVDTAISRSGLASLTVEAAGLSGDQKAFVPASLQRGKMVVPYIVGAPSASDFNFLFRDATNGLTPWTTYDTAWTQGNVVLASTANGNTVITGNVSADSVKLSDSLTGSGTISLGVLEDGSRAAQAGIINNTNTLTVAPAIDSGTAELVVWKNTGTTRLLALDGPVSTSGGLSKNGDSILRLANATNDITGPVAVNQGTLRITGGNGLGDSAKLFVAAGGTFDLSGASDQVALLTGDGAVTLASTRTLTVSGTESGTFSGTISGAGNLAKGGTGVLTLSGVNTYTGATTVSEGTLLVNGSTAADSAFSVIANAIIGGDGTINGNLTLANGALFAFDPLATLDLGGTLALNESFGVASLRNSSGGAIDWSSIAVGTYTLMNTSFEFNSGNISNFGSDNAATGLAGGRSAYFQNGSLQLVVIPEPGTLALLGIAFAALVRGSLRKRA